MEVFVWPQMLPYRFKFYWKVNGWPTVLTKCPQQVLYVLFAFCTPERCPLRIFLSFSPAYRKKTTIETFHMTFLVIFEIQVWHQSGQ